MQSLNWAPLYVHLCRRRSHYCRHRTMLLCTSQVEINQVDRRILPAQKKHFLVMCGISAVPWQHAYSRGGGGAAEVIISKSSSDDIFNLLYILIYCQGFSFLRTCKRATTSISLSTSLLIKTLRLFWSCQALLVLLAQLKVLSFSSSLLNLAFVGEKSEEVG